MTKTLFLTLVSTLFSLYAPAQEFSQAWGSISEEELALTEYEQDPEAEAVILYDIGDAYFTEGLDNFLIRFKRRKRIKILREEGLKYAEVQIPYYINGAGNKEKIRDIKAIAYNWENGKVVTNEINKKSVFDVETRPLWRAKKFAIPHVKVGTIIEISYTLETPFMFNLPAWYFQSRIPTLFSQYTVKMIPFCEYAAIWQRIDLSDLKVAEEALSQRNLGGATFREMIYTFEKTDIPAFKDESYITSIHDYLMKVEFQLATINYRTGGSKDIVTTWPKLVKDLNERENFGVYIKKSKKFAENILKEEIQLEGLSDLKKAEKLIKFVKSSYRWNGNRGHMARKTPKEFHTQKGGTVSEMNLFLVALLRAAGIEATPIISSTRDHGQIETSYPFEHYFNYTLVLVEAGNKSFLTDATANSLNYNLIPTRSINYMGLLIDDKEGEWISLGSKGYSLNKKVIRMELDPQKEIAKTSLSMQCTAFEAYNYKARYKDDVAKLTSFFEQSAFDSLYSVQTMNFAKTKAPYIVQVEGQTELEKVGENLLVYPLLGLSLKENLLTQDERSYPVDFIYEKAQEFSSAIGIPANYKVGGLPEAYISDDELVTISLEYIGNENFIEVKAKYIFKKAIYQPEEYKNLQAHIDTIIKLFNQPIVIEKI